MTHTISMFTIQCFAKVFIHQKDYNINTTYSIHENALCADGLQSLPLKEDVPVGVTDLQKL